MSEHFQSVSFLRTGTIVGVDSVRARYEILDLLPLYVNGNLKTDITNDYLDENR